LPAGLSKKAIPQTGQILPVKNLIFSRQSEQKYFSSSGRKIAVHPGQMGG